MKTDLYGCDALLNGSKNCKLKALISSPNKIVKITIEKRLNFLTIKIT